MGSGVVRWLGTPRAELLKGWHLRVRQKRVYKCAIGFVFGVPVLSWSEAAMYTSFIYEEQEEREVVIALNNQNCPATFLASN